MTVVPDSSGETQGHIGPWMRCMNLVHVVRASMSPQLDLHYNPETTPDGDPTDLHATFAEVCGEGRAATHEQAILKSSAWCGLL